MALMVWLENRLLRVFNRRVIVIMSAPTKTGTLQWEQKQIMDIKK